MSATRILIYGTNPVSGETIRNIAHLHGLESAYTTDPDRFKEQLKQWSPTHIAIDLIQENPDCSIITGLAKEHAFQGSVFIVGNIDARSVAQCQQELKQNKLKYSGCLPTNFSSEQFRTLLKLASHPFDQNEKTTRLPLSGAHLKRMLDNNSLQVVFQPKIHVESKAIAGFEVLSRWEDEDFGAVSPAVFIGMAEQRNSINQLTEQVFSKALPQFSQLIKQAGATTQADELTLSINISAQALDDDDLQSNLAKLCDKHGISRNQIILELTETKAMEEPRSAEILLERLSQRGFLLAIDDFGSGYTTMLQLSRMPFSEVKVEKSLVIAAPESREAELATRAVVQLAKSLGLKATAAGVEDQPTLTMLEEIKCHYCQGFFIAKPMTAPELMSWINNYHA